MYEIESGDALSRQGRLLDAYRAVEEPQPLEHPTHLCNVAAELDYRGGIAGGEPGGDLGLVERRWNDGERVIPRDQRDCRGGGAGGQGRDARDDLDLVAACKAGEYIYKASVEKRIPLAQQRHVM